MMGQILNHGQSSHLSLRGCCYWIMVASLALLHIVQIGLNIQLQQPTQEVVWLSIFGLWFTIYALIRVTY